LNKLKIENINEKDINNFNEIDDLKDDMMATHEKIFSEPPKSLSKFIIVEKYSKDKNYNKKNN
jgi:hypothetical protein